MLACVIVSLAFVLFLVFSLFVRTKSLHRLAAAGKLDGMDEAELLAEFGVPVNRFPDPNADPACPREILEFTIPNESNVRVFIDPATRTVTGSTVGKPAGRTDTPASSPDDDSHAG